MGYDRTDFEWSVIEPVLPKGKPGPRREGDRRVMNGIFWVLRAGAPRRHLPERYGTYTAAYNRFNRWRKAGVWDRLMDAVTKAHDGKVQMIDGSIVRGHQHASGVKKEWSSLCWAKSRRPHDEDRRAGPPGPPPDLSRRASDQAPRQRVRASIGNGGVARWLGDTPAICGHGWSRL